MNITIDQWASRLPSDSGHTAYGNPDLTFAHGNAAKALASYRERIAIKYDLAVVTLYFHLAPICHESIQLTASVAHAVCQ
jgi:hypothetical protein